MSSNQSSIEALDKTKQISHYLGRNAVECLPKGELERKLELARNEGRRLRVKLGIDPTAADIHLGHTVVLQKLREFQDYGHLVVLIIGDFTARIGDPSGQSATRPVLEREEIETNAETFQQQAFKVLDREKTEVRFNSEWLDMPMEELFKLMRVVTVAQVLERDDFQTRYRGGQPISLLELLYPVMQGYDSVVIDADIEVGGTDQKFNLLVGRQLQQARGLQPQAIMTMPILPGTDGEMRMSKSTGNYIGITEPAEEMFGKVMSIPDLSIGLYHDLLLGEEIDLGVEPNLAKRELARRIVERFHGQGSAATAERHFDRLHKERQAPDVIEEAVIGSGVVSDGKVHLPALIAEIFGGSRSDARRNIEQGGVKLDGKAVDADQLDLALEHLDGAVVQVGKRKFRRLRADR